MDLFAKQRMERHQHNAAEHPDGVGAIDTPDLPEDIGDGVRDYAEDDR